MKLFSFLGCGLPGVNPNRATISKLELDTNWAAIDSIGIPLFKLCV